MQCIIVSLTVPIQVNIISNSNEIKNVLKSFYYYEYLSTNQMFDIADYRIKCSH